MGISLLVRRASRSLFRHNNLSKPERASRPFGNVYATHGADLTMAGCAKLFLVTFLGFIAAPALAEESLLDSLGRAAGVIAPTPEPPDFVKASRSAKPQEEIPAFAEPDEPRSHVKTPAELKAMDADLDHASRRQHAGQDPAKPRRRAAADAR
jgi:hypothetical protein